MPNSNTERNTSILQWNVQGISTSKEDILKIINEKKPAVLAFQETFLGNDFNIRIPGYNVLSKKGHYNHRFHGGVALYIHSSYPYSEIQIVSPIQVVAAKIRIHPSKVVTIASIYISGKHPFVESQFNDVINTLPRPFILMGDLNAHHSIWGNVTIDRRGRLLENLVRDQQLNIINTGQPTHCSGSAIDLTIVSPELSPDLTWNTGPSVLSSDHFPIIVNVINPEQNQPPVSNEFNFRRANWKEYGADAIWESLPDEVGQDPASVINDLYQLLSILKEKWVPRYKGGRFYPKPWWSSECSRVWRERERCYRVYRRTHSINDKVEWKKARALATKTFKEEKKREWAEYVSGLNINATSSEIWNKIRKIKGRTPKKIEILELNGLEYSTIPDIANVLADKMAEITSNENYDQAFTVHKNREENCMLDFNSTNEEPYNSLFTLTELQQAINECKNNSPGPDGVHNKMFKCMPISGREYLLKVINLAWKTSFFDDKWRHATIVPIPKPNKNLKDPSNYRPISLTSCLCKLIEKMVNTRLINYLENKKFFAHTQCGFRKNRSTVDHLIRFETFIRSSLAESKHVASVFFDMEKAYDKAWRFGILKDLHDFEIRGRLPLFVSGFLKNRSFQTRVEGVLSAPKIQETGVPQGSTLSVTLFAIKINSLHKSIPNSLFSSMYVDDIQIAYSHYDHEELRVKLQEGVNAISKWAHRNGFSLSPTKTVAMQFYKDRAPVQQITLDLNENRIPLKDNVKFLGLMFDPKLTFIPHINQLKSKCLKSLNLLRSVSTDKWGSDCQTLMSLYRMLIRSKIDYGSIVYASASEATLANLEPIQNEAIRIATGAFRTTPISSLQILANEPPMHFRRRELSLKYYFKLKSQITNPAFNYVINSNLQLFFESRPNSTPPFLIRALKYINEYNIEKTPVLPQITPKYMEHEMESPVVDIEMCSFDKALTPASVLRGIYTDIVNVKYPNYHTIFTDGSKSVRGVGAAAVSCHGKKTASLPKLASIFTAEMKALHLALKMAEDCNPGSTVICSDSLSSLIAIGKSGQKNEMIRRLRSLFHDLYEKGNNVKFFWIPSHCGIEGNESADNEAKNAANKPREFIPVPYTDLYPSIEQRTRELWKIRWSTEVKHLKEISGEPKRWCTKRALKRRDEVIINRLRLGHCAATHKYLFERGINPPPVCSLCGSDIMTVKHLMIECQQLRRLRNKYFGTSARTVNMKELLGDNIDINSLLKFLKEAGLYEII